MDNLRNKIKGWLANYRSNVIIIRHIKILGWILNFLLYYGYLKIFIFLNRKLCTKNTYIHLNVLSFLMKKTKVFLSTYVLRLEDYLQNF